MSSKTKFIQIEILSDKEGDFRNLIKGLSDSRIREVIYEYPYECRSNLKGFLDCFPIDMKYEKELSQKVGLMKPLEKRGAQSVSYVLDYVKKENIKIKDEEYLKNFLPFITKYILLQDNPSSSRFRNSLIKTIYNFISFVAPSETKYKHHKLTAFICQHLGILEKEIIESEVVGTIKNVLKTTTTKDIYQDQLKKDLIQVIDSSDPQGYNVFLRKLE